MPGPASRKMKIDDSSGLGTHKGYPYGRRFPGRGEVSSPDAGIHVLIPKVITRWGMLFRWGRLILEWAGRGNPAPTLAAFG